MADFDVVVIGGGPAGYSAALKGAELGASVALVEAEQPGGACVNHSCIPANVLMGSVRTFLEAQELGVMGVFQAGETFHFARAAARKDALVIALRDGISGALRMRRVRFIEGHARFVSPSSLEVSAKDGGASTLTAEAFVIATGTRWEPPAIPGVAASRILTPDAVQALPLAPASALVVADTPGDIPFGAEYAVLLAVSGGAVTLATAAPKLFPALEDDVAAFAIGGLADMGIEIHEGVSIEAGPDDVSITLKGAAGAVTVAAEVIVAADPRVPFFQSLHLAAAGVVTTTVVPVDRACRTNVAHIFAAGDVSGGAMLTNAAAHMGEVAATNATGGSASTRLDRLPRLLHTFPETGWVGISAAGARARGLDVATGTADLSYNARAVSLGARKGIVRVVVERSLGEVVGVHVCGPEAGEIIAVAAALMQSEVPVADLAAMVHWHPAVAEGLAEAARRALSSREA
ncbi:MAG: dihydrolipoyl dehydrogenase family protein [Tepidiformaceae bacterium]